MVNGSRRNQLEETLRDYIRQAEKVALNDPDLQQMVRQLRQVYLNDKETFLFALGLAPPPPRTGGPVHPSPPPSRIPELLMLLNSIVTRNPAALPPSTKQKPGGMPGPLLAPEVTLPGKVAGFPASKPNKVPPSPARKHPRDIQRQEIETVESDIKKAEALFRQVKNDEQAIKEKQGKYAISLERLKAERLLRELPGTIMELVRKKKMLEEGLTTPNGE